VKLPNAKKAVVEERKIRDYLLSDSHPIGRFKAAFFKRVGFDQSNWDELRDALLLIVRENDAEEGDASEYGQKFLVLGRITGPSGRMAEVQTVWMIPADSDAPRFVTVYPR